MQPAFWWAIVTASVIGSLHCAGMCGPIAVMASGCSRGQQRGQCVGVYQLGRLGSYLLLGLLAGTLGAALDLGGDLLGYQQMAAYVAGGTLILVGVVSLLRWWGVKIPYQRIPAWVSKPLRYGQQRIKTLSPRRRALLLGGLTGALPCGWLYAFVLIAAGTAHPLTGMAVMGVFWIGAVPVLVGISWSASWALQKFQRQATWITAVLVIAVGILTVSQRTGWTLEGTALERPVSSQPLDASGVNQLSEELPPCCQSHE